MTRLENVGRSSSERLTHGTPRDRDGRELGHIFSTWETKSSIKTIDCRLVLSGNRCGTQVGETLPGTLWKSWSLVLNTAARSHTVGQTDPLSTRSWRVNVHKRSNKEGWNGRRTGFENNGCDVQEQITVFSRHCSRTQSRRSVEHAVVCRWSEQETKFRKGNHCPKWTNGISLASPGKQVICVK